MNTPEVSYVRYNLFINKRSLLSERDYYWDPVGSNSQSVDESLSWLKADFNIYKEFPNIKYKVVKTTYYKPAIEDILQGERDI